LERRPGVTLRRGDEEYHVNSLACVFAPWLAEDDVVTLWTLRGIGRPCVYWILTIKPPIAKTG
jgi:hypothetical protein